MDSQSLKDLLDVTFGELNSKVEADVGKVVAASVVAAGAAVVAALVPRLNPPKPVDAAEVLVAGVEAVLY